MKIIDIILLHCTTTWQNFEGKSVVLNDENSKKICKPYSVFSFYVFMYDPMSVCLPQSVVCGLFYSFQGEGRYCDSKLMQWINKLVWCNALFSSQNRFNVLISM